MSRPVHRKLDIYGTELHLAFDEQGWRSLRRMNPNLDDPSELGYGGAYDTRHEDTDQQHVWIWVGLGKPHGDAADLIDTIAHEATHAALMILTRHAITLDEGNGEPMAYLVGWLTAWMMRAIPNDEA